MATQNWSVTLACTNADYEVLSAELEAQYKKPFSTGKAIEWLKSGESTWYEGEKRDGGGELMNQFELKQYLLDAPIEEMPLLINSDIPTIQVIVRWRLKIAR